MVLASDSNIPALASLCYCVGPSFVSLLGTDRNLVGPGKLPWKKPRPINEISGSYAFFLLVKGEHPLSVLWVTNISPSMLHMISRFSMGMGRMQLVGQIKRRRCFRLYFVKWCAVSRMKPFQEFTHYIMCSRLFVVQEERFCWS